jgi:predicted lipid carrier protein YhbT
MMNGDATIRSHRPMRRGDLPAVIHRMMRWLPLAPLEIRANAVMAATLARRPEIRQRLGEHAGKRFAIDPTDCPFIFLLKPHAGKSALRVVRSLPRVEYDARIAGVLMVLIGLLDGAYDGDALLGSRDLVVEGDTAAVLALRNAIKAAALTPDVPLGVPERLGPLVNTGIRRASRHVRRLLGAPGEMRPAEMPGQSP